MKAIFKNKVWGRPLRRGVALTAALVALGACQTTQSAPPNEGIGFREARFAEISAMRDYRACQEEAIEFDELARSSGDTAKYRKSADIASGCEAGLGPEAANVAVQERMQGYALGIQNYLKAGELDKASANLQKFKKAFPDKDLYYADGSSFTETMEILLGQRDESDLAPFARLNVNAALKDELRRARYWKYN